MITCPWCATNKLTVKYSTKEISRPGIDRDSIKRIRHCEKCNEGIATIEIPEHRYNKIWENSVTLIKLQKSLEKEIKHL